MSKNFSLLFLIALCFCHNTSAQETKWTWMAGTSNSQFPVYGTKGAPGARNSPGNISRSISWTDDNGDFWLYGSGGHDQASYTKSVVMKLDGNNWTWVAGDINANGLPVWGVQGVSDEKNTPGRRIGAAHCYKNGKLYLFGGNSYNDLWEWDGKTWTWIAGPNSESVQGSYGVIGVADPSNLPPSRPLAASWVDDDGNFWLFGGTGSSYLNDLWKWDGENWTWVSGNKAGSKNYHYGVIGQPDSKNMPRGRTGGMEWQDENSQFFVFGGIGKDRNGVVGVLGDLWRWDGQYWTWMSGDSLLGTGGSYGQKFVPNSSNAPKSRIAACHWKDLSGRVWLYGGFHSSLLLNDLWMWDGDNWTWFDGSSDGFDEPNYGEIEVEAPTNQPGGRYNSVFWTGKDGTLWLYGGEVWNGSEPSSANDLWRLRFAPFKQMVVMGNGRVIEAQDMVPDLADFTDFGSISITNVPLQRKFVIRNVGNETFELWEDPIAMAGGSTHFKVVKQPEQLKLEPGKSVEFVIAFDPDVIGVHNTVVFVNVKDFTEPYQFAITGVGTPPNITLIDTVTCSTARLFIEKRDFDHYTVLVSDSGKTEFPVDTGNYNYSPYYLRAPFVNQHPSMQKYARILYQGSKTEILMEELVAGRSYQVVVVPGNGPSGNTKYQIDSASILFFHTPGSSWQDSLLITPNQDTGLCEADTIYLSGKSPFPFEWQDGKTDEIRQAVQSDRYYFITVDPNQCWLSSDSVGVGVFVLPTVDSIYVITPKPWCEGDTLLLDTDASHAVYWEGVEGEDQPLYLPVTENGTYSLTTVSFPGCSASASVRVDFDRAPTAYFLEDSYTAYGEEIVPTYYADVADVTWQYGGQEVEDFTELKIADDGWLRLVAISEDQCLVIDSAEVFRREVVLRAIPNAFSPDGDGTNDKWFFLHENLEGELTIFNRWGGVVYQGSPLWDGKLLEEALPTGTYFYHYLFEENGEGKVLSGHIKLIR